MHYLHCFIILPTDEKYYKQESSIAILPLKNVSQIQHTFSQTQRERVKFSENARN